MRVIGEYVHAGGEVVRDKFPHEYNEVLDAATALDALACLTKISLERNRQRELVDEADPTDGTRKKKPPKSPLIFSPPAINRRLKHYLYPLGWARNTPDGYREHSIELGDAEHPRSMDGIKNGVGLEIQFSKYAFMGYDILSKMVIFKQLGLIRAGIEVVVMKSLWKEMSSGPGYFEQIVADLEARGASDLDIPTLIIGLGLTDEEVAGMAEKREEYRAENAGRKKRIPKKTKPGPKPGSSDRR